MSATAEISCIKNRKRGIDVLRILAAFSIITIHLGPGAEYPILIREGIALAARYAVPLYFMISGYFLAGNLDGGDKKTIQTIAKISKVFMAASIIYVPFVGFRDGWKLLMQTLTHFEFLLYGTFFHLWFLSSLLFGVIFIVIWHKLGFGRWLWIFSFIISSLYISQNYWRKCDPVQFDYFRYLAGIAQIHIGMLVHHWHASRKTRISTALTTGLLGIFIIIIEAVCAKKFLSIDLEQVQLPIGALLIAMGALQMALQLPPHTFRHLASWGERYSLGIYIMHPIVISVMRNIYELVGVFGEIWSTMLMPILVFISTMLGLIIWNAIMANAGVAKIKIWENFR